METARLFGRQPTARSLADLVRFRTSANLGQLEVDQQELERVIDENKWLDNWTEAMCDLAGEEPGSPGWERCRMRMAQRAVGGAPAGRRSPGSCRPCEQGPSRLLQLAREVGRQVG